MPNFRRYYIPNSLVFITCVTYERLPLLKGQPALGIFWQTLRNVQEIHPFHLLAYVILPDHFHWIMQLPEDQPNFSTVMQSIKWNFTFNYKKTCTNPPAKHLWQKRFWDHIIRDEKDLERHIDYIHWNPVKHQHVDFPEAWEESSFTHWTRQGYYPANWGNAIEPKEIQGFQIEE